MLCASVGKVLAKDSLQLWETQTSHPSPPPTKLTVHFSPSPNRPLFCVPVSASGNNRLLSGPPFSRVVPVPFRFHTAFQNDLKKKKGLFFNQAVLHSQQNCLENKHNVGKPMLKSITAHLPASEPLCCCWRKGHNHASGTHFT